MRQVNAKELEQKSMAGDPAAVGQAIQTMLSQIESIQALETAVKDLTGEVNSLWKQLKAVQAGVAQGEQYQHDHDELHRNMAQATSKLDGELQKQVASMIQDALVSMKATISEISNRPVQVAVDVPAAPAPQVVHSDPQVIHIQEGDSVLEVDLKRGPDGMKGRIIKRGNQ